MPFGITSRSAPEHFQRRMSELLRDIEGVVVLIDDILVTGRTKEEYDRRLIQAVTLLGKTNLTLCIEKCEFGVKFVCQMVDQDGIQPDPDKVKAIQEMSPPKT